MKLTKLSAAGAAIGAMALALTACGGGGGSQSGSATGEKVELTFQSLYDQPKAIALVDEIVEQWNSDNPDVQVKIVPAGWDGIYDKLITQFNGGSAPDIIHYDAASIIPFAQDGFLADLSPLMTDETKADIPEGILDTVTVNDEIIAFPTEMQSYLTFANRGMFEEAGIEIPTGETMSWTELREIAKKLTGDGKYGLGWGLKSPTAAFMALGPGFGGTYFVGSGLDAQIDVGEAELALPSLINDMNTVDKSLLPVSLSQTGSEVLAAFYDGQIGMTIQGSFQGANMATDAPEDLDWVVLPPMEGTVSAEQAANPQTLSVNIDSKHVPEAVEFIEYLTSSENLAKLNEADSLIPATLSAREIMAEAQADDPAATAILNSGQFLTTAPYLFADLYPQWKDTAATPAFQRFLSGEINADQLGQQLTSGWEEISR